MEGKTVSEREFCSKKTLALLINSVMASNYNKRGQNALSRRRVVRDELELTKPGGKKTYPGRKGVILAGLISAFEIYSRGLYPLNRLRFVMGCFHQSWTLTRLGISAKNPRSRRFIQI